MRDFIKDFIQDITKIVPIIADKRVKLAVIKAHPPDTDKEYIKSETFFDFEGNKIEHKSYSAGKIIAWKKFIYKDGKLNEILEGKSKWKGGSYNLTDFHFTPIALRTSRKREFEEIKEQEQNIISTFWEAGKIKSRRVFNNNNICVEVNEFTTKGALINRELYNDVGQLLEARRFKSDGTALNYTINAYNEKSQLCRSISVSRTGHPTYDTVLKYNAEGLLVEYVDNPIDPENAFADLKDTYNGFAHKYLYTDDKFLDTDELYQYGKYIMSYKYSYEFW